jgi:hypothetical protein
MSEFSELSESVHMSVVCDVSKEENSKACLMANSSAVKILAGDGSVHQWLVSFTVMALPTP